MLSTCSACAARLLVYNPCCSLHQRINQVPNLLWRNDNGSPFTSHPQEATSIVNSHLLGRLDCAKVLADQQVADAHRTEYRAVLAQMIGLAWTDQAKAVEAVLWFSGNPMDGVTASGLGYWRPSLRSLVHRAVGQGCAFKAPGLG